MLFLLFVLPFAIAAIDCHIIPKQQILSCVLLADTNNDNIITPTEFDAFISLNNGPVFYASHSVFLQTERPDNYNLTIADWNEITSAKVLIEICSFCKNNVAAWSK